MICILNVNQITLKKDRYNKTDIDWSYLSYSKIYLALGSEDIYYLPSAVGLGKIVDVLTPSGQIDLTIPLMTSQYLYNISQK